MTEKFSPKLGQITSRSEKSTDEESQRNFARSNGEDDKRSKANPWKPIVSSENNALEAEAWPEPSVPAEQRRPAASRQAEEKPKRKIKWQNFEFENSVCAPLRGRGRFGGGSFTGPFHTPGSNPRPFRRGSGSYRGHMMTDSGRGRGTNGYYPRHPGRVQSIRPTDLKAGSANDVPLPNDASSVEVISEAVLNSSGSTQIIPEVPGIEDKSPDDPVSSASRDLSSLRLSANCTPTACVPSKGELDPQITRSNQASGQTSATPRKSYRDRNSSVQQPTQSANLPTGYEAGPAGRQKRSFLRQHQPGFPSEADGFQPNTLVANSTLQPLSTQPIPHFTYIIADTQGVLGPTLQLAPNPNATPVIQGAIPPVSIATQAILPTQPSVEHPVAALPQLTMDGLPVPIISNDTPVPQHVTQNFIQPNAILTPTIPNSGDVQAQVVDISHMISFINRIGWSRTNFPAGLRDHPTVSAAIRDAVDKSPDNTDSIDSSNNKTDASSLSSIPSRTEDSGAKPSKPEDVVVVDNCYFFVPRNSSRTKFLKFTSKLDYIRHHVEYYFSESNLQRDTHLYSILSGNQDVCPLNDLLQFNRLRWVSTTESELLEAVSGSSLLAVTYTHEGVPVGITRISTTLPKPNESTSAIEANFTSQQVAPSFTSVPNTSTSDPTSNQTTQPPNIVASSNSGNTTSTPPRSTSSFSTQSFSSSHVFTPNNLSGVYVSNLTGQAQGMVPIPLNVHPSCYGQTHTYFLNPGHRAVLANASPNNAYSSPSQAHAGMPPLSPFYQSDVANTLNMRFAQQALNAQLYSQQQAAALVAAVTNQQGLLPSSNNPNIASPDSNAATFISTFYRFGTPGNQAYLPSVANTVGINTTPNHGVPFQFVPGTQNPGGYFTSNSLNGPPNGGSLMNRSVVPANAGAVLLPLNTASNASGSVMSAPHHIHPFVTFAQGPACLTVPNASNNNMAFYSGPTPHSLSTNPFGNSAVVSEFNSFPNQKHLNHSQPHNIRGYTNHQSPGSVATSVAVASLANSASPSNSVISIASCPTPVTQTNISQNSGTSSLAPAVAVPQQNASGLLNKRLPTMTQP